MTHVKKQQKDLEAAIKAMLLTCQEHVFFI